MKFKIQILKKIDAIIGTPAVYLSRVVRPRKSELFSESGLTTLRRSKYNRLKILVIRPGGIGDAVLLFPALKVLRDEYKDCKIDMLVEKRNQGIFENCEYINNIILYDDKPLKSLLKVFGEKYEIVIDTEQWYRLTSVIGYLTRSPIRVGFSTNERSKLFTHSVDYSHQEYELLSFLNLVSAVTKNKYAFNPNNAFIHVDNDRSADLVQKIKEHNKRWDKIVGIFSGATVVERMWEIGNFIETSKRLTEMNIGLVILGGKSEVDDSAELEKAVGQEKLLNFVGKTTLYETALIISNLNLFISSDTGLMHIAYGLGTPTVSLFGAGIEPKWGPKGDKNIVLNKKLSCSPCTKFGSTPRCRINVRCLQDISVDEVISSVKKLLNSN
jgi:ADP-heptose:LPS heptosyltransferase